jgi:hypothetical protein
MDGVADEVATDECPSRVGTSKPQDEKEMQMRKVFLTAMTVLFLSTSLATTAPGTAQAVPADLTPEAPAGPGPERIPFPWETEPPMPEVPPEPTPDYPMPPRTDPTFPVPEESSADASPDDTEDASSTGSESAEDSAEITNVVPACDYDDDDVIPACDESAEVESEDDSASDETVLIECVPGYYPVYGSDPSSTEDDKCVPWGKDTSVDDPAPLETPEVKPLYSPAVQRGWDLLQKGLAVVGAFEAAGKVWDWIKPKPNDCGGAYLFGIRGFNLLELKKAWEDGRVPEGEYPCVIPNPIR